MIGEQSRIRAHIRFFVNGTQSRDLAQTLRPTDALIIAQALGGD